MADSNCEQGMGLMSINENSVSDFWGAPDNSSTRNIASAGKMNDLETANKLNPWIDSSSTSAGNPMLYSADQAAGSVDSTTHKVHETFEIPIMYQPNNEYVCHFCHLDVIVLFCVLLMQKYIMTCKCGCYLQNYLVTIFCRRSPPSVYFFERVI